MRHLLEAIIREFGLSSMSDIVKMRRKLHDNRNVVLRNDQEIEHLSNETFIEVLIRESAQPIFPKIKIWRKFFVVILSDLVFLLFFTPFSLWNKVDYIFLKFSFNFAVVKTKYCESRFMWSLLLSFGYYIGLTKIISVLGFCRWNDQKRDLAIKHHMTKMNCTCSS
jgi:hypothetical protein